MPLASIANGLFALQLAANGAWSWIFFRFHQLGWASMDIVALAVVVGAWLLVSGSVVPVMRWSRCTWPGSSSRRR